MARTARICSLLTISILAAGPAAGVAAAAKHHHGGSSHKRHHAKRPRPGTLLGSFGHRGQSTLGAGTQLLAVTVQRDGKILAVGRYGGAGRTGVLLARFRPSGKLDRSFGHGGTTHGPTLSGRDRFSVGRAVRVTSGGKILVVGSATDATGTYSDGMIIERYTSKGRLDTRFASHGVQELLGGSSFGSGNAVALAPGGKIIAAGSAEGPGTGGVAPRIAVVRLHPSGAPDRSFGSGGTALIDLGPFSSASGVAVQRGGKLVIAGSQATGLQITNALVARLTRSGALDHSFASGGSYVHQYALGASYSSFNAVTTTRGGTIIAVGSAAKQSSSAAAFLTRFSSSGHQLGGATYTASATNFLGSVTPPGASAVTLAAHGEILAAGAVVDGITSRLAVWAFTGGGAPARGFGTRGGALLPVASGRSSQGSGIALTRGGFVVVGAAHPTVKQSFTGLIARYAL